jgi:bisphosphoglycerate-independent phosphoglycerate mutase
MKQEKYLPVVMIIADGFGEGKPGKGNAIDQAKTPYLDSLRKGYFFAALEADPKKLGLEGLEVLDSKSGHMILGSGQVPKNGSDGELLEGGAVDVCLGSVISQKGMGQLRVAEVEKYGHVTKFFDCEHEEAFENEDYALIIPDFETAHYQKKPEMNAAEVSRRVLREISTGKYAFVVINFGNADVVGHHREIDETIEAVEAIDRNIAEIVPVVIDLFGAAIITSDHGMVEEKKPSGKETHNHTKSPVPFYLVGEGFEKKEYPKEGKGSMLDVAPTVLTLLGQPVPAEMKGKSLV